MNMHTRFTPEPALALVFVPGLEFAAYEHKAYIQVTVGDLGTGRRGLVLQAAHLMEKQGRQFDHMRLMIGLSPGERGNEPPCFSAIRNLMARQADSLDGHNRWKPFGVSTARTARMLDEALTAPADTPAGAAAQAVAHCQANGIATLFVVVTPLQHSARTFDEVLEAAQGTSLEVLAVPAQTQVPGLEGQRAAVVEPLPPATFAPFRHLYDLLPPHLAVASVVQEAGNDAEMQAELVGLFNAGRRRIRALKDKRQAVAREQAVQRLVATRPPIPQVEYHEYDEIA